MQNETAGRHGGFLAWPEASWKNGMWLFWGVCRSLRWSWGSIRFGQLRLVPFVGKPALLHVCIGIRTNTADLNFTSMSQSSSSTMLSNIFGYTTHTHTIEVMDTFVFECSSHADARRGMGDVRKIWHDTSCLSAKRWHTFTDKMTGALETICKMNVVDCYSVLVVFQADWRMTLVNWIVDLVVLETGFVANLRCRLNGSRPHHRHANAEGVDETDDGAAGLCSMSWSFWSSYRIALKHSEKRWLLTYIVKLGRCKQQSS